jgi:hypothetical protein
VKDVSELTSKERAKYYRDLANEALQQAERAADNAARSSYICIAEQFKRIALAADAGKDPDDTIPP